MKTNILPEKHVRTGESLIGLGAVVLSLTQQKPKTLDKVWTEIKDTNSTRNKIHGTITLDKVILAIDLLFSLGALKLNNKGLIEHASN